MALFVAVDIGCIECGEKSAVLGVFETKEEAESVCNEHAGRHQEKWDGQHSFEVFRVPAIGVIVRTEYE